jgi:hypothetical protein
VKVHSNGEIVTKPVKTYRVLSDAILCGDLPPSWRLCTTILPE